MADAMSLGIADMLRVLAALAVVAGVIVVLGWLLRKGRRSGATRRLHVEERLNLSRGVSLMILGEGDRRLLVGVSEKGVSLVTELESRPRVEELALEAGSSIPPVTKGLASTIDFAKVLAGRLKVRGGAQ